LDTNETSRSQGTILIADDDEPTRELLCQILRRAGFVVRALENGQLACLEARRDAPDVILMDWVMPVMDGRAAVEELKSDPRTRGIPIIMLTAQSEIDERVIALGAGVQDFVTKPFEPRELIARIEQQMRWRRMLAADANVAFAADRLALYRPVPSGAGDQPESFFDRIWGSPAKTGKRR